MGEGDNVNDTKAAWMEDVSGSLSFIYIETNPTTPLLCYSLSKCMFDSQNYLVVGYIEHIGQDEYMIFDWIYKLDMIGYIQDMALQSVGLDDPTTLCFLRQD